MIDSRSAGPKYSLNGELLHNYILIERMDDFATYIKFRFKAENYCFKCNKPFHSHNDLKSHKREIHSY